MLDRGDDPRVRPCNVEHRTGVREVAVNINDGTSTTYASSFVSVIHVNNGPNHAPVAGPDAFTLGSTNSGLGSSLFFNDTDADNDLLTASGVVDGTLTGNYYLVEGTYGELRVSTDGEINYNLALTGGATPSGS